MSRLGRRHVIQAYLAGALWAFAYSTAGLYTVGVRGVGQEAFAPGWPCRGRWRRPCPASGC